MVTKHRGSTGEQRVFHKRRQDCDIVIALSHQLNCEEFVSRTRGIDLLLAGHELCNKKI